MTGFLVINHFLKGKKFDELHEYLVNSAQKMGIDLKIKTNQQMIFEAETPDFVLFWDKDVALARSLEGRGIPVFNSANTIALCDDKAKTYNALLGKVCQPKTIIAPLSFFDSDYSEFVHLAGQELGFPLVFKECCGSFGEQVFLCENEEDVLSHITQKPFILQEYIECNGTDTRLEMIDGKCVSAMKRHNENDFRSNITNGGTAIAYTPSQAELDLAVRACKVLGVTFGGIDILGEKYVCEVNSNAHIINIKNVTGVDIAPMIFESILKKL